MGGAMGLQGLRLVTGAGEGDGRGAGPVAELDGRQADAGGRRRDHHEVAHAGLAELGDRHGGEVLHPDRRGLDLREALWDR